MDGPDQYHCHAHLTLRISTKATEYPDPGLQPKVLAKWMTNFVGVWMAHSSTLKFLADFGAIITHNGQSSDDTHADVDSFLLAAVISYKAVKVKIARTYLNSTNLSSSVYPWFDGQCTISPRAWHR